MEKLEEILKNENKLFEYLVANSFSFENAKDIILGWMKEAHDIGYTLGKNNTADWIINKQDNDRAENGQ